MGDDALPVVSIVTPSLNQGGFIAECIGSVAGQDYEAIEHIVVDGGSSDQTLDVLRRAASHRLRWVSEPDAGQSDAINKGWNMARGDVLAWMNADDMYLPGAVRAAVDFLSQRPEVDIVYGDCEWVDEKAARSVRHTAPGDFDPARLMYHDYIPSGSAFLRRRVLETIGPMDVTYHYVMDWEYWLRAAACGCRFAYVPRPLSRFRIHAAAKTWAHHLPRARELTRLMDALGEIAPVAAVREDAQARGYLSAALLAGRAGVRGEALRYYLRSIHGRRFRISRLDLRPLAAMAFGVRGEKAVDTAAACLDRYLRRGDGQQ